MKALHCKKCMASYESKEIGTLVKSIDGRLYCNSCNSCLSANEVRTKKLLKQVESEPYLVISIFMILAALYLFLLIIGVEASVPLFLFAAVILSIVTKIYTYFIQHKIHSEWSG